MKRLTYTDIHQLIEVRSDWCVSIFMPTHSVGREQQQDPIRLKNLLSDAQARLMDSGMRRPDTQALLRPAVDLLADTGFWRHQSHGLAIFLASGFQEIFRLPLNFNKLLVISPHFHIKPLLPLLSENGQFYILAISLNEIRLLLGSREDAFPVVLDNTPTSMREALYMDDPEKHLDLHTTSSSGRSAAGIAVFHGQGGISDSEKTNILRYFRYVDRGIMKDVNDKSISMLLAGVDYLLPIYRKANSYPRLIHVDIVGSPDEVSDKELRERAWEQLKPIIQEKQDKALAQLTQLLGSKNENASTDIKRIVLAAQAGMVECLFVPLGVQRWGQIIEDQHNVLLESQPTLKNYDLLDRAAVLTLEKGGSVYTLESELMPAKSELAAIMRYAV